MRSPGEVGSAFQASFDFRYVHHGVGADMGVAGEIQAYRDLRWHVEDGERALPSRLELVLRSSSVRLIEKKVARDPHRVTRGKSWSGLSVCVGVFLLAILRSGQGVAGRREGALHLACKVLRSWRRG